LIYALKALRIFVKQLLAAHPNGLFDTAGETNAERFCNASATADTEVPE
jgi:hypothetical protein